MKLIKHKLFIILAIIVMVICCRSTSEGQQVVCLPKQIHADSGPCYGNCSIPEHRTYKHYFEYFYRYTGVNPSQNGIEEVSFLTKEAEEKWVQKEIEDCSSINHKDCLVWSYEIIDEIVETFYEVVDTSFISEFNLDSVKITEILIENKGGSIEKKEIVCESKRTPQLYKNIQESLIYNGYDIKSDVDGIFWSATRKALTNYQRDNSLPVGGLNIETLEALGVDYDQE